MTKAQARFWWYLGQGYYEKELEQRLADDAEFERTWAQHQEAYGEEPEPAGFAGLDLRTYDNPKTMYGTDSPYDPPKEPVKGAYARAVERELSQALADSLGEPEVAEDPEEEKSAEDEAGPAVKGICRGVLVLKGSMYECALCDTWFTQSRAYRNDLSCPGPLRT